MTAKASTPKANKPALKVIKSPKATKSPKVTKSVKTSEVEKAPKTNDSLKTGLDPALVEKAVDALLKYNEKQSGNSDKLALLGDDRAVQVQFTLQRSPGNRSPKPMRILIPHPLYKLADASTKENAEALEEPEICLIVKEESKAWVQEMINRFPDHMGCVKKVLGLQSLRKKHAQYEQRRELLAKYNIFMADDRILPMLSKALGKDFFKAKKLPIPITLTRKEALPFAIQKALSATFMTIPEGTCITVRYVNSLSNCS
jgi:ribosome biogenesis protein UTP30